jgi:hypothetical protein
MGPKMGNTAQQASLFTVAQLSRELDRSEKSITKVLRNTKPDGLVGSRKGWKMTTVLKAIGEHDAYYINGHNWLGSNKGTDIDAAADAAHAAADDVADFLDRLRAERDIEARRVMVHTEGKCLVSSLVHSARSPKAIRSVRSFTTCCLLKRSTMFSACAIGSSTRTNLQDWLQVSRN